PPLRPAPFPTTTLFRSSACGGAGAQQSAPAPSHSEHSHGAEHSHHAGQADMGDPSATPAGQIEGAQLRTGQFELLDTRPPGFDRSEEHTSELQSRENLV